MEHQAPDRGSGAPLYDVTLNGIYPEDFYGPNGLRYYGDGQPMDARSYGIIQAFHNKPWRSITIYRSVPKLLTDKDKITQYQKAKAYILKHGKPPSWLDVPYNQRPYEWLNGEIERLQDIGAPQVTIKINPGDWVSINSEYVKMHGSDFKGGQRILSKTVSASDIYTNGDSFHEWGYDPS